MRFTDEENGRLKQKLERELGPTIRAALADPKTTEVLVNDDGYVRVERLGERIVKTEERFTPARAVGLLKTVATMRALSIGRAKPILECSLPGFRARIHGVLSPVAEAPNIAIRRHSDRIYTLAEYVAAGRMSEHAKNVLESGIAERLNIIVAGATGTGKTSLVNAMLAELERQEPSVRCGILECTREIQTHSTNHFQHAADDHGTDLKRLLKSALRMRPDRLIVGEVRGEEARDLLEALNTGHPGGYSTVHAASPVLALRRLEQAASHAGVNEETLRGDIGAAVGLVAALRRGPNGPRLTSIARVHGYDGRRYEVEELVGEETVQKEAVA